MFFGVHIPFWVVMLSGCLVCGSCFAFGVKFANWKWRDKIAKDPQGTQKEVLEYLDNQAKKEKLEAEENLKEAQEKFANLSTQK